jgi:branched-chain amino acid transport system permease protein
VRTFLIAALAAGLPLSNAFAQPQEPVPAFAPRETSWAVFFFLSAADDRTTRPETLNPNCWSSRTTGGIGASVEYKTPVSIVLGTVLLCAVLYAFFTRTRYGVAMQATSQNQLAAYYMGIPVKLMCSLIWAIVRRSRRSDWWGRIC